MPDAGCFVVLPSGGYTRDSSRLIANMIDQVLTTLA